MLNPLIILGSSRRNGSTLEALQYFRQAPIPLIDLSDLDMSYYDYQHSNRDDDFLSLAERMTLHSPLILATPVYWYSMSAIMKTFLDRWSDLLTIRKDLGRQLAGKKLFVVTSYSTSFPKGFEDPFSQTCEYMKMTYGGCYYYYSGSDPDLLEGNLDNGQRFMDQVFKP